MTDTPPSQPPSLQVATPRLVARPISELRPPTENDEDTLLHRRYLNRGGGLLLVGPTGIGKSSLSMQLMLNWALEIPVFGIAPARSLTSVLIQAENDDGDLVEMRDGVIRGLNLTEDLAQEAMSRVFVHNESTYTSDEFFASVVEPLLVAHRPDLLWIDPALAYLGGDAMSQEVVGTFLRNKLNPLLQRYRCGCVIIHHTNKPKQEKQIGSGADLAYAGSGSAEWSNWSRAVLTLQGTADRNIYKLHAAKRGGRIGWFEEDGTTKRFVQFLSHATGGNEIYWREATAQELARLSSRSRLPTAEEALVVVPATGSTPKSMVNELLRERFQISEKAARDVINNMVEEEVAFERHIPRPGKKPAVHLSREEQAEAVQE